MGRIAAGVPISAIQNNTHDITVPADMLGTGEHYALEVKGDSMIEAGIFDGDTVIIRNGSTANPGDIVVALVDDEEATLKRFRRKGASIALEAANPAYETRIFGPDRVEGPGQARRPHSPLSLKTGGSPSKVPASPIVCPMPHPRGRVSRSYNADPSSTGVPRSLFVSLPHPSGARFRP